MKKIPVFLLSLALVIPCFSGCRSTLKDSEELKLVTSFYPIYIMALNITDGVENVSVENIADQNIGCLHDFQIQAKDIKMIEKADALIINGASMESFMDKIIDQQINTHIIDSSIDIELIKEESQTDEEYNPHIWVSISNYIKQVKNISNGIISLDPKNEVKYKNNTNEYIEKLTILKDKMHRELNDVKGSNIVTFHEAFPYFAKEFNFNIAGIINREPNSTPSAQEVTDTINLVNKTNVKALFAEPQYSQEVADIISAETNVKIYLLDPASSGDVYKDSYIDTMTKNLNVLKEALS